MPTLDDLNAQLDGWYAALKALQKAQAYTIGGTKTGRQLTRADLPEVTKTIDWLEKKIAEKNSQLKGGTGITAGRMMVGD